MKPMMPRSVTRKRLVSRVARDVRREKLTTAEAVVVLYRDDHPEASVADAAKACGIPYVCVKGLES